MTVQDIDADTHLRELKAAKAEFEHMLRRLGDAAERSGALVGADAAELQRLRQNLADTEAEIARLETSRARPDSATS